VPKNFIPCDRDQQLLLPPSLTDWLPEDHLVWFVIDAVTRLDLSDFYDRHRDDGWGRAAFDPAMMVTLLLYAYALGVRSAREIERRVSDDVAMRVITAGEHPDHSTISRFRTRHREALSGLFEDVVGLCVEAGMVRPGIVAIDGTKLGANASPARNLTREQLADYARRVFDEAEAIDAEEDELYGDARGDELPEHLRKRSDRIEWLDEKLAERQAASDAGTPPSKRRKARINTTDPDSRMQKVPGGFVQGYNAQAAVTEDQIFIAASLTADNNDVSQLEPMITQSKSTLEAAGARSSIGTVVADAGYLSDDNVHLDLGCELLISPARRRDLEAAIEDRDQSLDDRLESFAAQRRRWQNRHDAARRRAARRAEMLDACEAGSVTVTEAAQVVGLPVPYLRWLKWHYRKFGSLPPARFPMPPPLPGPKEIMLSRFSQPGARVTYGARQTMVEPVFGQLKEARGMRRLLHRGLDACSSEWRMMATAHNLRKLWLNDRRAPGFLAHVMRWFGSGRLAFGV